MKILTMPQGTPEWFAARLGRATGSRFSDCIAKIKTGEAAGRRGYRTQLASERLTNRMEPSYSNAAMEWGTATEPHARAAYEFFTDTQVDTVGFIQHDDLMAGVSPDGLIGLDGMIEIKCPNTDTHIDYLQDNALPSKYRAQVQGQLWIAEREWADFVSFDPRVPHNCQLMIVRVERDEKYIKELSEGVAIFLHEVDALYTKLLNRHGAIAFNPPLAEAA